MRLSPIWLLSLILTIISLSFAKPARSQTSEPYIQTPKPPTSRPSSGFDPSRILDLINLINLLARPSSSTPTEQVDLSPDIAEIRGQISRLYFLLARQYSVQNQIPEACNALESAYITELEAYLRKRLRSRQPSSNDCYTSEVKRISQLTGSPTALIYATTSKGGLEIIAVTPPKTTKPAGIFPRTRVATKSLEEKLGIPSNVLSDDVLTQNSRTESYPVRKVEHNATTEQVDQVILDFRNNLQDYQSFDFLPQSQQLYNWVIRPIEPELEKSQIKTIVFVMNGNLRVVPPAAFHDGQRYLIEKYAVTSIPSWQLTEINRPDRTLTPQILAMGLSESVEGLPALPAAKLEVEVIASKVLVGKNYLNRDFTKDNLRSQISNQKFGIIHLATHAKFLQESPAKSFIQFWGDQLQMSQISNMNLTTDLLTLSACETAVGQHLGLAGLAVDSGATSVLASLWAVSDAGTAPFMVRFYSGLPSAPSKAIALQEAQLAFLNGEVKINNNHIQGIKGFPNIPFPINARGIDLKHPYFWSSFTLVGNWL